MQPIVMEISIISIIIALAFLWLGFYFGHYYGEGIYRCCRYWRLKAVRFFQGRHKYNDRIILGR